MEYIYLLIMVLLTTAGQLLTKKGSQVIAWEGPMCGNLKVIFNRYIVLAGIVTMISPIYYVFALKTLDLSVAFAFTAFNYIFVSFGGRCFFKEKLNKFHYLGVACIVGGVCIFNF
jgi:undecaprenyl phosphate-alpha-L-ara4N flippase subunit ArnE